MSSRDPSKLSDEQMDCAFDYFLFYDREMDQMDGGLDDPAALRHLLNDKQSDLELAAQIGKALLERNRELDRQLRETEKQMAGAVDKINQLQHSLGMKAEQLQFWTEQMENEGEEASDAISCFSDTDDWRSRRRRSEALSPSAAQASQEDIELIHRKLQALEEENAMIRSSREQQQAGALKECLSKLGDVLGFMKSLSEEHCRRSDTLMHQQSQVNALLTRSQALENNLNQVGMTNELLASKVDELSALNQSLVRELRDMKDKYDESLSLYAHAQATIRRLRDRSRRAGIRPTTCLLYSATDKTHSLSLAGSPSGENTLSIAEELRAVSKPVTDRPLVNPATSKVGGEGKVRTSVTDTGEWDDRTMDSSGFASASEPIDLSHRISQSRMSDSFAPIPLHLRAQVLTTTTETDEKRRPAVVGEDFDWEVDPEEVAVAVGDVGMDPDETEVEEVVQAFAQCDVSPPLASTDKVPRRVKTQQHQQHRSEPSALSRDPLPLFAGTSVEMSTVPANRRSWVVDQSSIVLPKQHSFDDTSPMTQPSLFSPHQPLGIRPQRLQLVKQLQGSGILQRWQRLATPSFTSALYESPLSGVASRAATTDADASAVALPTPQPLRWSSGFDLSRVQAFAPGDEKKFVPISSHPPLFQHSNTGALLTEYLASSSGLKRGFAIPLPKKVTSIEPTTKTDGGGCGGGGRGSPMGLRSSSPVCRGLLDVAEFVADPPIVDASIKVPLPPSPRCSSPQSGSGFRRQNVSRASPTLDSVKE